MNAHETAAYALKKLSQTGAQQYSCEAHTAEKREFNVDGGLFSLLRTTIDNRLDLTLIKDHRRGKVLINSFSAEAVDSAVSDCLASAGSAQEDPAWQLYEGTQKSFTLGTPQGDMDRLFQRSRELLETIKRDYPKVMVEQMIVEHESAKGIYLNSLGAEYETLEGSYSLSLMFSGHDGDKTSSFNGAGVSTDSLDTPLIELGALRQLLADAEKQIDTVATDGKFVGPVVFTPDCAGSMIYELLGNFVTDGVILDGTSLWKDKLGQMVADPSLTISAAPLHPAIVCGERYTSDGRVSQDYDIIKDGRLNAFALSSYVANKTGHKAAPNASFSLIVPAGSESIRDIIAGIDRGLLVSRFSGGSPSSSGDFSGVAKNSFLIENGQIGPAVSETMISGNLAGMFEKLRSISIERVQDGSTLMPYIAVDGITISGK